jgi:hypothetical protein
VSLRSKRRRHARRARLRSVMELAHETRRLFVAPDVLEAGGVRLVETARAAGIEIVSNTHLERGTIVAFRPTPLPTMFDTLPEVIR